MFSPFICRPIRASVGVSALGGLCLLASAGALALAVIVLYINVHIDAISEICTNINVYLYLFIVRNVHIDVHGGLWYTV